MHRLGILLSGRGSNFLAIAKAISEHRLSKAEIAVVLSNVEDAPAWPPPASSTCLPSLFHSQAASARNTMPR